MTSPEFTFLTTMVIMPTYLQKLLLLVMIITRLTHTDLDEAVVFFNVVIAPILQLRSSQTHAIFFVVKD